MERIPFDPSLTVNPSFSVVLDGNTYFVDCQFLSITDRWYIRLRASNQVVLCYQPLIASNDYQDVQLFATLNFKTNIVYRASAKAFEIGGVKSVCSGNFIPPTPVLPPRLIVNSIVSAITLAFEGSNIYRSDGNSVYLVGGGGSIWGDTDIFVLQGTSAAYIVSPSGLVLNTSASILFGASTFSHGISITDKAYYYSAGNLQRATLGGSIELSVAYEGTTVVFKGSDALWVVPASDQTKIHKLSLVNFSLIEVFSGLSIQPFKHIVETNNYIFASCAAGIFSIKKSDSGTLFNVYFGLGTNPFLTAHNDKIYLSRHEAASIYVFDEELNLLNTLVTAPNPNQSIIIGSTLYVGCQ